MVPAAYDIRYWHAEALFYLGRYDRAADEYERVVALDPAEQAPAGGGLDHDRGHRAPDRGGGRALSLGDRGRARALVAGAGE